MSTLGEIEEALGVLAFGYLQLTEKPTMRTFFLSQHQQEAIL